jgi:hypothetical protein
MALLTATGAFAQSHDPQWDSDLMNSVRLFELMSEMADDIEANMPTQHDINSVNDFETRRMTVAEMRSQAPNLFDQTVEEFHRLDELEARATSETQRATIEFHRSVGTGILTRLAGIMDELSSRAYAFDAIHMILEDAGIFAQSVFQARDVAQDQWLYAHFFLENLYQEVTSNGGPCYLAGWYLYMGGHAEMANLRYRSALAWSYYNDVSGGFQNYAEHQWILDHYLLYGNPLLDTFFLIVDLDAATDRLQEGIDANIAECF